MKKTRRKFVISAVIAVFASLVVLLGILNILVFTNAAADADALTEMLAAGKGDFNKDDRRNEWSKEGGMFDPDRFGPMGPDSPETTNSLRYFTVSIDKETGETALVSYRISAVSEDEATEWAESLKNEKTGWTRGTYRYRVYKQSGKIYVTVIDQGRELLPAYRILMYSVLGTVIGTLVSLLILMFVGQKLFAPLEEADRKQKKFLAAAELEFKLPLTVINADTEIIERENGPTEQTNSIRRQVSKMNELVKTIGSFSVFEEDKNSGQEFMLDEVLKAAVDKNLAGFESRGVKVSLELEQAKFKGDREAFARTFDEIAENILKYAKTEATFKLSELNGRIKLTASNDTDLPDGTVNQVFDRFVTLENSNGSAGLGLAFVKETVDRHNGRENARVENGRFILTIDL